MKGDEILHFVLRTPFRMTVGCSALRSEWRWGRCALRICGYL